MMLIAAIGQACGNRRGQAACAAPNQRQEDIGVEQKPHASGGNERRRKSSGSGASKSSAMKATIVSIPCFCLNSSIASRRRPLRGRCGASSNAGEPLRVTTIVSPRDLARELGQAILRLANGYGPHGTNVATHSHNDNAEFVTQTLPPGGAREWRRAARRPCGAAIDRP